MWRNIIFLLGGRKLSSENEVRLVGFFKTIMWSRWWWFPNCGEPWNRVRKCLEGCLRAEEGEWLTPQEGSNSSLDHHQASQGSQEAPFSCQEHLPTLPPILPLRFCLRHILPRSPQTKNPGWLEVTKQGRQILGEIWAFRFTVVKKKSYQKILIDSKITYGRLQVPLLRSYFFLFQRKPQMLQESWENHKAAGVDGITGERLHRGCGLIVGSCVTSLMYWRLPLCLIQQGWPSSGAAAMAGGFSWLASQSPKRQVPLLPGKGQWAEGTLRDSCQWWPPCKQPAKDSNEISHHPQELPKQYQEQEQ